ncbi:hypothetical protein NDU88_006472 [Pleurodeles waltl]|uniref:Secreted protein n=1 Tax=Pleurodeles waltl TaxID=8319 RepID=A0AAV7MZL2_PLEWA|nr:hypothetical protein NDU88_006472 [Pleurodeles waltl]
MAEAMHREKRVTHLCLHFRALCSGALTCWLHGMHPGRLVGLLIPMAEISGDDGWQLPQRTSRKQLLATLNLIIMDGRVAEARSTKRSYMELPFPGC